MEMQNYKGSVWGLPSWGWSGYDCIVANELALKEIGVDPMPDATTYSTTWEQILEWIEKTPQGLG